MTAEHTSNNPEKLPLIGMTLADLEGVVRSGGMPRFVGKQIAQWL